MLPKVIFVTLGLLVCAVFWPAMQEHRRASDAAERLELANVPLLDAKALDAEFNNMYKTFEADKMAAPEEYIKLNELRKNVDRLYRKRTNKVGRMSDYRWQTWDAMNTNFLGVINNTMRDYQNKFGIATMQNVSDRFYKTHPELMPAIIRVETNFGDLFWAGYLRSIAVALIFFSFRVQRRGLSPLVEIWRIVPCSVLWFVCIFFYPQRIDVKRAARRALECLVYVNSLFYSVACMMGAGFASVIAKAQTTSLPVIKSSVAKEKKKKRQLGTVTLTTGISSEFASNTTGGIFSPDPNQETVLQVSLTNGTYGYLMHNMGWNDLKLSSDSADWLSYGVGQSLNLGKGFSGNIETCYMNGKPLSSMTKGDYLMFIMKGAKTFTIAHGTVSVSPYVKYIDAVEFDTGRRATYGYTGVAGSTVIRGIKLSPSVETKFDPGNLGKAPAAIVAVKNGFSIPLTKDKRLTLCPFVGTQGPVWKGGKDSRSWELWGGASVNFSFSM